MAKLLFEDHTIETNQDESVLDALTRSGHVIPFGCRAGVCQSCMLKAEKGSIPAAAQTGLNSAQTSLNFFLSCQCHPDDDLSICRTDHASMLETTVLSKEFVNDQVIRLRLQAELNYQAGQFVTLWKDDSLGRSYSLASVPEQDDFLEFHIKVIPDGQFSQFLKNEVAEGDTLQLQGPLGECMYSADDQTQSLLLAAIGTGLAPVYGIAREALAKGHTGDINMIVAARDASNFYLVDELLALAEAHANFNVTFLSQTGETDYSQQGDVYAFAKENYADLAGWRIFLCGADSFVRKMRKHGFLSGAKMADISADSFVAAS
jgi:NAD(P)H-flavin reductase